MPSPPAVAFQSPSSLAVEMQLPNRGVVKGMGIPLRVTLIVGGGFHGKSTLLKALEMGVYNKASFAMGTCLCHRLCAAFPINIWLKVGLLSCAVFNDAPATVPASRPAVASCQQGFLAVGAWGWQGAGCHRCLGCQDPS